MISVQSFMSNFPHNISTGRLLFYMWNLYLTQWTIRNRKAVKLLFHNVIVMIYLAVFKANVPGSVHPSPRCYFMFGTFILQRGPHVTEKKLLFLYVSS